MSNQCLALTAKGTQCRYKAKEGTLCGGHIKNGAKYGEVSSATEPEAATQRTADDYRTALVSITMDGLRGEGRKSEKAKRKKKQTAARRRARISRRGY